MKIIRTLIFIFIIFLIVGSYIIIKNKNYDIKENKDDRASLLNDLSGWVVNVFNNTKEVAEKIEEKEWFPESNETSLDK